MFPSSWFVDDEFAQSFWPHDGAEQPNQTATAVAVGSSRYDRAAVYQQVWLETQREAIWNDRINAHLLMQRAARLIEWEATLEITRKRQQEESMYAVLMSEL